MAERDYKKEYEQESPERRKARAARNRVRYRCEKQGRVKKGDGKHVHHVDHNPLNDAPKNVRVRDATANMRDNQKPVQSAIFIGTPTVFMGTTPFKDSC